ncbi:MAG: GIY-YIG nuclease family protein [Candidatus Kapaibacterium sp.]
MNFKTFAVYILANSRNTVLYTGVTNDLVRRIAEHKAKTFPAFRSNTMSKNLFTSNGSKIRNLQFFERSKSKPVLGLKKRPSSIL